MDYGLTEIVDLAKQEHVTVNTVIAATVEEIADTRQDHYNFMISLVEPWLQYMHAPEERNPNFPSVTVNNVAPGQPWDIGDTGIAIEPDAESIFGAFGTWSAALYAEFEGQRLPNRFDILRAWKIILYYGYTWIYRHDAPIEAVFALASDFRSALVVSRHIKHYTKGLSVAIPQWDDVYKAWTNEIVPGKKPTTRDREASLKALLFPSATDSARVKRGVALTMMREAVKGETENRATWDPKTNTFSMRFAERNDASVFMDSLGVPKRVQKNTVPGYNLWLEIGDLLVDGNFLMAGQKIKALSQEIASASY